MDMVLSLSFFVHLPGLLLFFLQLLYQGWIIMFDSKPLVGQFQGNDTPFSVSSGTNRRKKI
tara:strand:+ start:150 stop:332 length:183 start_codon:yes stop_codon:yes gene_type:complete